MNSIQTSINATSEQVRPYLPPMVKRMGWTFLPPVMLGLVINLFGRELLAQFLPYSTASIIVLVIFIGILYYGWRYLDNRYGGIRLYMLWLLFSRERRELRGLLKQGETSNAVLNERVQQMEQAAREFMQAMSA